MHICDPPSLSETVFPTLTVFLWVPFKVFTLGTRCLANPWGSQRNLSVHVCMEQACVLRKEGMSHKAPKVLQTVCVRECMFCVNE